MFDRQNEYYVTKGVQEAVPYQLHLFEEYQSVSGVENDLITMLIQNHVVEMGYQGYLVANFVSSTRN